MRTTTELTARFALLNTVDPLAYAENLWEEHEGEWSREEEIAAQRCDAHDLYEDALDFDTVPFETVEADLAEELFEQDNAEKRACEDHVCCAQCGREEDGDADFHYYAYQFICPSCAPKSKEERLAFRELNYKRAMRIWEKKLAAAEKFRAALAKAKAMRPDMNWAKYEYDHRQYPGPKPFLNWG